MKQLGNHIIRIVALFVLVPLLTACEGNYVPKPRGYYRIAIPQERYANLNEQTNMRALPYTFDVSENATVSIRKDEQEWIDIHYPAFDVDIHCTYYPVRKNLRALSDDAAQFVFNHAGIATGIPEQGFVNEEADVYGVFFNLQGNTASPYQFYMTDSTKHFFRGAVYFNCTPNQDSLAPVVEYLERDVRRMMETFKWQ